MKRKNIFVFLVMMSCMTIGLLVPVTVVRAAGHGIEITSPSNNSVVTNVFRTAMNSGETKYLTFAYRIENYDGYYYAYKVLLDGKPQDDLVNTSFNENTKIVEKSYILDGQMFLNAHGQGVHTFTVIAYHRKLISDLSPGLSPGPGSQYSYTTDSCSVSFTFDPIVVHFIGFWYTESNGNEWKDSILPFYDLLRSSRAHYLLGYHYLTGSWDDDKPGEVFKDALAPLENSNDIDIVVFYSHGVSSCILGHYLECPEGFAADGCLTRNELKRAFLNAQLDSSTILLIIDCCNSGMFTDSFKDTNIIVLTSSKDGEPSSYIGDSYYSSSWSMEKKLYEMDSLFLHSLVQGLYYQGSLSKVFNHIAYWSFYDDDFTPGIQHKNYDYPRNPDSHGNKLSPFDQQQHPDETNLDRIADTSLIFYDNSVV